MAMDKNAYCPGGTDKKIKHCMCQDILGELDKIITAAGGDQRIAALDRINRTMATKANRPCLLALKISLLLEMKDMQSLEDTVTTFVKVAPDNPLAHTFAAMLESRKNRVPEAVDELQTAVSLVKHTLPLELASAFGHIGMQLAAEGQYLAARAHVTTSAVLTENDELTARALMLLLGSDRPLLIMKRTLTFLPCPAGATWKARFESALQDTSKVLWKRGLERFEKLDQDFPDQPVILHNIAMARSVLAAPKAAEAWRAYARCAGVEFEAAVEAEALSQVLASAPLDTIPLVRWTINVQDANAVNEKLLSSSQLLAVPGDPAEYRQGDGPPPKSAYIVLDRPMPDADVELTVENTPRMTANLFLFGRETDRAPRIEMRIAKSDNQSAVRMLLQELAGELLTPDESEEIEGTVPTLQWALTPRCVFGDRATEPARNRIHHDAMQRALIEHWPDIKFAAFDGQTPRQVVGEPAYRVPLAGALLVLESQAESGNWPVDVNLLRQELGVPIPEPIDPHTVDIRDLPPARWARVMSERLSDDDLWWLHEQAAIYRAPRAFINTARQLVERPSQAQKVDLANLHAGMAEMSGTTDEAVTYIQAAEKAALADGKSPAAFLLRELGIRFARGEAQEVHDLLRRIETRHITEPGVREALYEMLVRVGLIRPDGQPVSMPATPERAEPVPTDSPIWTPGTPQPGDQSKKPSQLWVPD